MDPPKIAEEQNLMTCT